MTVLTSDERRKRVLDLHSQGMGTREIAKLLHMSFTDIVKILKDPDEEKESEQQRTRQELEKKYGIPVDDISKLAAIVKGVRHLFGYDVQKVVDALFKLESLKAEYKCQAWITELSNRYHTINQQCSYLQEIVTSYNQSLSVYGELAE
jgi:hypothetical protein